MDSIFGPSDWETELGLPLDNNNEELEEWRRKVAVAELAKLLKQHISNSRMEEGNVSAASNRVWMMILTALAAVMFFHWWQQQKAKKEEEEKEAKPAVVVVLSEEERRLRRVRLAVAASTRTIGTADDGNNESNIKETTSIPVTTTSSATKTNMMQTKPQTTTLLEQKQAYTSGTNKAPLMKPYDATPKTAPSQPRAQPKTLKKTDEPGVNHSDGEAVTDISSANSNIQNTKTPPTKQSSTLLGKRPSQGTLKDKTSDNVKKSKANDSTNMDTSDKKETKLPVQQQQRQKQQQPPPPVQILCHALSWIVQENIQVEPKSEAGTWGGVGWKTFLPPPCSAANSTISTSTTTVTNATGTTTEQNGLVNRQLAFHRLYQLYHPTTTSTCTVATNKDSYSGKTNEGAAAEFEKEGQATAAAAALLKKEEHANDDDNDVSAEWKAVLAAFSEILRNPDLIVSVSSPSLPVTAASASSFSSSSTSSSSTPNDGWRPIHLRQVLQRYRQTESLLRNEGSPLIQWWTMTSATNKSRKFLKTNATDGAAATQSSSSIMSGPWPFVTLAIRIYQKWLLDQVVNLWLGPPDELRLVSYNSTNNNKYDDDDDDEGEDLFDDAYNDSALMSAEEQAAAAAYRLSSPNQGSIRMPAPQPVSAEVVNGTKPPSSSRDTVDQLLALLENEEMDKVLVTSSFLDGLIHSYQDRYQDSFLQTTGKESSTACLFLAQVLLGQCLHGLRALMADHVDDETTPPSFVMFLIRRRLAVCSQLCVRSTHVVQALVYHFDKEASTILASTTMNSKSGRDVERLLLIQPLCYLAAYTVPDVMTLGEAQLMMLVRVTTSITGRSNGMAKFLLAQLQTLENFPLCVFSKKNPRESKAVLQLVEECQTGIRIMRQTAMTLLSKALARNKSTVIRWLAAIISTNEGLSNILLREILELDGIAAASSSPAFLLGLAATFLAFCSVSLSDRFEKQGMDAFDYQYLEMGRPELRFGDKSMVPASSAEHDESEVRAKTTAKPAPSIKFAGATEFFFLASALLRVSIYPVLRMEGLFYGKYSGIISKLSAPEPKLPPAAIQAAAPITAALLGWNIFLNDPDFVATMTNFSLLQLRWLVSITRSNATALKTVPEWMCKEPARWLSHVAYQAAQDLKPHQANAAVDCAIELLQYGSNAARGRPVFSPVILTELIQIASAFVQAGARRAKRRQTLRRGHHTDDPENSDLPEDECHLDAFLSFDQNDLGVTVFTNRLVCTKLCPALLTAFCSIDIVEGLDYEKDAIDKHSAKFEIGNLLLLLWSHPSGEFRTSIIRLPGEDILKFVSSLATLMKTLVGISIDRFSDVCQNHKRQSSSVEEKEFAQVLLSRAVGACHGARRFSLLMCYLSREDKLATIIGSGIGSSRSVCFELANMIIHFIINLLTTPEGGTKPDLEVIDSKETSWSMLLRSLDMTDIEKGVRVTEILKSRHFALREIGLDVATLCHTFLALAAAWHWASKGIASVSPILDAFAANDDCDIHHLRNVYNRMVRKPGLLVGTEVENASTIFEYDGYVDTTLWIEKYHTAPTSESEESRWRTARLCKVTPQEIEKVASEEDIQAFLDDLDDLLRSKSTGPLESVAVNIQDAQSRILRAERNMAEEGYGECLAEWVVSSDSFANPNDRSSYMHYYDKIARSKGNRGSGKQLVKEARRCHKGLPTPHSNSASFVCFDDSRMDLCRAIVTGPCDTPFSLGVFVFDVFFPPTFPQIPPLMTFMTTGGGTVRFGPNLYQDGKVCLSILGNTDSFDESQRWHPGVSSLAQILLSIQTQLLITEPYFNEPATEAMRGSRLGEIGSKRFNNGVRLATLRHAIISYLRAPPRGFEEVTLRHFAICRVRIVVQALRWMMEAEGTPLYSKFQKAYWELLSLLSLKTLERYESLPPHTEDVQAVLKHDPTLLRELLDEKEDERKPRARPRTFASAEQTSEGHEAGNAEPPTTTSDVMALAVGANPWAGGVSFARLPATASAQTQEDTVDNDFEDLYS